MRVGLVLGSKVILISIQGCRGINERLFWTRLID